MYTASAWMEVWSITKYKDMLERLQRKTLPPVANGYRTISKPAIQVLTGKPNVIVAGGGETGPSHFDIRKLYINKDERKAKNSFLVEKFLEWVNRKN